MKINFRLAIAAVVCINLVENTIASKKGPHNSLQDLSLSYIAAGSKKIPLIYERTTNSDTGCFYMRIT